MKISYNIWDAVSEASFIAMKYLKCEPKQNIYFYITIRNWVEILHELLKIPWLQCDEY